MFSLDNKVHLLMFEGQLSKKIHDREFTQDDFHPDPTFQQRAQCISDFGATCYSCRIPLDVTVGDAGWDCGHFIAYSRGGPTVRVNLRPLCITCNRSMQDTSIGEFIRTNNKLGPTFAMMQTDDKLLKAHSLEHLRSLIR